MEEDEEHSTLLKSSTCSSLSKSRPLSLFVKGKATPPISPTSPSSSAHSHLMSHIHSYHLFMSFSIIIEYQSNRESHPLRCAKLLSLRTSQSWAWRLKARLCATDAPTVGTAKSKAANATS